ncbi:MAG: UDP-N-acetylglucosamine 1-carboxyvinyltransferase [Bdellovibrionales bacterium]
MDKMVVKGGIQLNGVTAASGAKNSVLPLIFATLLGDGEHIFHNVPDLVDVKSACSLLEHLGCEISYKDHTLRILVKGVKTYEAPYDIVRKMRASILVLGPLLARFKEAKVSLPGGCAIGTRPIDLHLEGMKALGGEIEVESGYVLSKTSGLRGAKILFESPTVGGTENIMMAATLADGETIIENAAKEPEIVDLANYLNKMGAKVEGAGTSIIRIQGVSKLKAAEHDVIPDRIEAGTLLIAGAITGGEVTVQKCQPQDLEALIAKMTESGFKISVDKSSMTVHKCSGWKGVDITTSPHPAFPTDLQAQFMALMIQAQGTSVITETVFENRFMHVQELTRLNADITPKTRVAVVRGSKGKLMGAPVMATDLRASACLVLAGLVASEETTVNRIYHLDRGYENMEAKLSKLGAKVHRIE